MTELKLVKQSHHEILKGNHGTAFVLAFSKEPGSEYKELCMCEGVFLNSDPENDNLWTIRKELNVGEIEEIKLLTGQMLYDYDAFWEVNYDWFYFDATRGGLVKVSCDDMDLALLKDCYWFRNSSEELRLQMLRAFALGCTSFFREFRRLVDNECIDVERVTELKIPDKWNFARIRIQFLVNISGEIKVGEHVSERMCLHMPLPHSNLSCRELRYEEFMKHSETIKMLRIVKWNPIEIEKWEASRIRKLLEKHKQ